MKQIFIGILVCVVMLLSACEAQQPEPVGSQTLSVPSGEEHKEDKTVSSVSRSESSKLDTTSDEKLQSDPKEPSSSPETQTENTTTPAVSPKPSETPDSTHQPQTAPPAVSKSPEPLPASPSETEAPPAAESYPTSEPEPEQNSEHSVEQDFDINFWVSYARDYGQSLGLNYDSTATDCWDNPIIASGRSLYLERDIKSRLELYAADGMTYFCVWAQSRSDGSYDLYIGYA
jgi:cytoskeletal protein RodZ